ncbi:hypothetical protein SNE40_020306 [Patella caerulea]
MVALNKIMAVALAFCFWISDDSVKAQESSSTGTSYSNPYSSSPLGDTEVMVSSGNTVQPIQQDTHDTNHSDNESKEMSTLENYGYSTLRSLDSSVKEKCLCGLDKNEMYYIIIAAVGGTVLGVSLAVVVLCLVMGRSPKSEEDALHDEALKRATGETNGEATNRATSGTNGEALAPVVEEPAENNENSYSVLPA